MALFYRKVVGVRPGIRADSEVGPNHIDVDVCGVGENSASSRYVDVVESVGNGDVDRDR